MFSISIASEVARTRAAENKRIADEERAKAEKRYAERLEEEIDMQISEASNEGQFVAKIYASTRTYDLTGWGNAQCPKTPQWLKSVLERYGDAGYEIGPVRAEYRDTWYFILLIHWK